MLKAKPVAVTYKGSKFFVYSCDDGGSPGKKVLVETRSGKTWEAVLGPKADQVFTGAFLPAITKIWVGSSGSWQCSHIHGSKASAGACARHQGPGPRGEGRRPQLDTLPSDSLIRVLYFLDEAKDYPPPQEPETPPQEPETPSQDPRLRLEGKIAGLLENFRSLALVGCVGTGKTHSALAAAKAYTGSENAVYVQGVVSDEVGLAGYEVKDFLKETEVTRWILSENPKATLILDEADRYAPEALVWLNPILANGIAEIPHHGKVEIAPTKRVIATANTFFEPSSKFTTANSHDLSIRDRFEIWLEVPRDEDLERVLVEEISGQGSYARQRSLRDRVEAQSPLKWGLRRMLVTARLVRSGIPWEESVGLAGLCALDGWEKFV